LIAENWSDLLGGSIYMSLKSAGITTESWWSFSSANGNWDSSKNCIGGTSTSDQGMVGSPDSISSAWLSWTNRSCANSYALICIAKP
ncbi:MAG: hypothetical protein VX003_12420, partial [SAR324 cluster bacterium]|nr:hypothetical protein [SAR324 cluster bacterium]